MSAAELKEMRREVKKFIDHADESFVRKVYDDAKAEASAEEEYTLTPEQEAELDRRMVLDAKGLVKYSSWEDVKARILSKKRK